ncbi:MAG: hypothetical protein A2509_05740 [Candidatus Edwardsbacteria bacterium RIFOXYD12_FULL_50_11]|uniref:Uncharacterized protein n=1 Tax=Candidatus Edwardsbacteria bacterium GWF2_54_11 TaxID=1817851 RepID=A0A1F5R4Q8_9BACT|nr:MAG: hypothetical protein A2502_10875 [Candidatus Edwardsbacteria bacterium RifOxyC12_full_54_24]OGF06669.1 MAG: hypothetical protein A2273_00190 [Candidatus Edwardsbacteria bacterium RifOxyA12_full_54_48]OGF09416.1 MAG: hypothetical protein A2024_00550 [Candidatus Edwardsbacteria bacterium GWF2_54_11]OGF10620.1 MAG: hypothetical protein A3K15_05555 [Candidatus Edwardsbacteria bacterium GWE2_54_12]OGF15401.1 MAG: hypothetical protein A2509_05740 [Candidatus Edwardsbacteria bacterium RIFOXYD1
MLPDLPAVGKVLLQRPGVIRFGETGTEFLQSTQLEFPDRFPFPTLELGPAAVAVTVGQFVGNGIKTGNIAHAVGTHLNRIIL